jgi:hypothetical protein
VTELPARIGIVLLCGCGVLSALVELALIPLYAGTVPVGLAAVLAIVGNIALVLLGRELVSAGGLRIAPFAAWLLTIVVIALFPRPEGDNLAPGGGLTWVTYGVLFGGALAGTLTAVFTAAPPRR